MGKYRKILVAFDVSEPGANALRQAFRLANDEKCWITVVSVIPPYEGDLAMTGLANLGEAMQKPCEDALAEAKRIAEAERALIKTVCETGPIHERIIDVAEEENCDLIVLGRTGRRGLGRALIGSVAARVIGFSRRDVMVVPPGARIGWERLLLATDGSRYSAAAGERAIDFAKSYGGEIQAVSVVDIPPETFAEAMNAVEKLTAKAKEFVEDVKKAAQARGVKATGFVGEGEAYQVITSLAEKERADVIVMGSHGRTGLRRLLMGSVAERAIGHASCPVLVVKS